MHICSGNQEIKNKKQSLMFFYFTNILIFFIVPLLYFFNVSKSLGFALSTVSVFTFIYLVLISKIKIRFNHSALSFLIIIFLYSIGVIFFIENTNYTKFILSLISLFCISTWANYFSISLLNLPLKKIVKFYKYFLLILIVLAFIDNFYLKDLFFNNEKTIFPSREHSHFYLNYFFFFILLTRFYKFPIFIFLLLVMLYLFPSLTGVLVLAFAILIFFKLNVRNLFLIFIFLFCIFLVMLFNYEYYYFRIIDYSINKSALTYLQGWTYVIDTFKTYPFGIGFQQMNCNNDFLVNQYSELISQLTHSLDGHQCEDGGFNVSKLTVELGIFGFFISLLLTYQSLKGLILIKFKYTENVDHRIIFNLMMIPFIVDLWFRSAGLLSVNLFLFITGFIGMQLMRKK